MMYVIGIDVGGTHTDCMPVDENGSDFKDKSFTVLRKPGEVIPRVADSDPWY